MAEMVVTTSPAPLPIDPGDYGKRVTLSVAPAKEGGSVVKIAKKNSPNASIKIRPGDSVAIIVGQELFAVSDKETKLTIS